ncbi:MAG: sterol desaturase family protein [Gemmatimonadaceae bacterium]|nr:sterol desaturase family protein [Gemmatimonadaceae bacterium]
MGIIKASIPIFLVLLVAELGYARWRGLALSRLNDSLADLACGILSQLSGIFLKLLTIGIYLWIWERARVQHWLPALPEWPAGAPITFAGGLAGITVHGAELLSWTAAFLLVDLQYYFAHRYSHEINVLWAGHVVHHSSEEYNLSVALRQSSLHGILSWVFYIPTAMLGVPVAMYVTCYALNLIYQFWIHTRAVGRMGRWAESVLNTPSHHRVHHGVNPKYQDKNYAGVFIIWDRFFGTYQVEEEEPVYGITHPLRSWNPLWANVHVFVDIARRVLTSRSLGEAWGYVFGPPGWRPDDLGGRERPPEVSRATFTPYDPAIPGALAAYGLLQFIVTLVGAFLLLTFANRFTLAENGAMTLAIAVSLASVAGIFEGVRWAASFEAARMGAALIAGIVVLSVGGAPAVIAGVVAGFAVLSLLWFLPQRQALTGRDIAPMM